jgi:hypothetical protein
MELKMDKLGKLVRVSKVELLEGYTVQIEFEDGQEKTINLEPYLRGPIFERIRADRDEFLSMKVEAGVISWPNGADIDPDVLYYGLEPAWKAEPEGVKKS